jgi:hypothetical protein
LTQTAQRLRLASELSRLASSSVEERPGLARSELLAVVASGIGDVATTVGDPGNGLSAAGVGSLDVSLLTSAGVLDALLLAAVGADPLVAELAALLDGKNIVGGTVDVEVRDGSVATVAAGEEGTRDNGNGSEVVGTGASNAVAHSATIAETSSKNLLLINAEVVLGKSEHLISEGDILATLVGPTSVETVGSNEDSRVTSQVLKTVVAALGNVVHVTAEPVVTEDKLVGLVVLVVVGKLEDVLSVLAVDVHVLDSVSGALLATAS